jgi:hypothetical protein
MEITKQNDGVTVRFTWADVRELFNSSGFIGKLRAALQPFIR